MKILKKYWLEIFFFFVVLFIFSFKTVSSYKFDSDFGRDLMWMYDICHGKITLLGPKLSFGGYYLGPYYYYFFAPFLLIGKYLPSYVLLSNSLIFAVLITITFSFLRKRVAVTTAFIASLWIAISPYSLFSARNPGNAFSYAALMILYLFLVSFSNEVNMKTVVFWSICTGLMMNFHPVSLMAIVPLTILHLFWQKKEKFRKIITYGICSALFLTPIFLFELKHGFVMTKNTFIVKSYEVFTHPTNPASIVVPSKNPILNLLVMNNVMGPWLFPSVSILVLLTVILFLKFKKNTFDVINIISLLITIAIYSVLLRFQVAFYYLSPLLAIVQIQLIFYISKFKNRLMSVLIVLGCLLYSLLYFPKQYYAPTVRSFDVLYQSTNNAVRELPLPKSNFNIIVIRETPLAILGYEYRYILRTVGYKSDDEFSYSSSNYLLLISEKGNIDTTKLSSWEIDQFGKKEIVKSFSNGKYVWYLFKKI